MLPFRTRFCPLVLLVTALAISPVVAHAQYFPTFSSPTASALSQSGTGVSIATVPAYTQPTEVLAIVNFGGNIYAYYSTDGIHYSGLTFLTTSGYCSATSHTYECSSAVATYNGAVYVAFRNYTAGYLNIWKGTRDVSDNEYTFQQVQQINVGNGGMSTAPSMIEYNSDLFIIYGVASVNGYNNGLSETYTSNGTSWSTTTAGLGSVSIASPAPVGLSVLNGTLYMTSQQNNSNRNLFYWSSPNGFSWSGHEDSSLQLDSGSSMVTFNGYLVAAIKQNNSQNHVYLFSSADGSTWHAQEQTNMVMEANTTPAMTLFDGGVALAYISSNGADIEGAFASN